MTTPREELEEIKSKQSRNPLIRDAGKVDQLLSLCERVIAENEKLAENADKAFCLWCGHVGKRDPEEMVAHMESCEKHPMKEILRLSARLAEVEQKAIKVRCCYAGSVQPCPIHEKKASLAPRGEKEK